MSTTTPLQVFVGRSTSAHGPFIDQSGVDMVNNGGTLVIASHGDVFAPGGEGVFTDSKSGKDIFVYHYLHSQGDIAYKEANSSLGLNAIDWSSVSCGCYLNFGRACSDQSGSVGMASLDKYLTSFVDAIEVLECKEGRVEL